MADPVKNPSSWACHVGVQSYLNTIISNGGYGGSLACRVGELRTGGGVMPAFGAGFSAAEFDAKLIAHGNSNTPGTSISSNSKVGYLGLARQEDFFVRDNGSVLTGYQEGAEIRRLVNRNTTLLGIGSYSIPEANADWTTAHIRAETSFGIDLHKATDGFTATLGGSFIKESVIAINKPVDTLRDDALRLSIMAWLELGWRTTISGRSETDEVTKSELSMTHLYYMYADAMAGLSTLLDYYSINRDTAYAQEAFSAAPGSPFERNALSEKNHLLAMSALFNPVGLAAQRRQYFNQSSDWQGNLLIYHGLRSAAMLGFAAKDDTQSNILAAPAISSLRTMADMLVLKNSDSSKETLGWHLGLSALLLLGALGDRKNGIALGAAQAGMEGLLTTTMDPNPRGNGHFVSGKEQFARVAKYGRRHGAFEISDKRLTIGQRTTLVDETVYTESSLSSSFATGDIATPASVESAIGAQLISGKFSDAIRVRGGIDAGVRMEMNGTGTEFGARLQAGADLVIKPDPSLSFSATLGARCSASKFASGHDTECGLSLGISF